MATKTNGRPATAQSGVKLMLDTHIWLWIIDKPEKLNARVQALLQDDANTLMLSAATPWEITIKAAKGRLDLPSGITPTQLMLDLVADFGAVHLPIRHDHTVRVSELDDHHSDPFDRILMAQALVEDACLVTADSQIAKYAGVRVEWAG